MAKKIDVEFMSYIFGALSVVFAFFQPLAGVILGIIGVKQVSKGKSELAMKARRLGIIGIVVGAVIFILTMIAVYTQAFNLTS